MQADGNVIFGGGRNGTVCVVDVRLKRMHTEIGIVGSAPVTCLEFRDSVNLYSGHLNGTVRLWDVRYPATEFRSFSSRNQIKNFTFQLAQNKILISATDTGILNAWNVETGILISSKKWRDIGSDVIKPLYQWDDEEECLWIAAQNSNAVFRWK